LLKRKDYIEDIIEGLSVLQYYIKFSSNKLGLYDINKVCEPFFGDLFNILWNKNFKRLEYEEKNYPGIDLGDKSSKTAMQITTDGSKTKLWHTIEKFDGKKSYKKYNILIHFIIGEKHYTPKITDKIMFDKISSGNIYYAEIKEESKKYQIQIIDLLDLILLIDEQDSRKILEIRDYIKGNISTQILKIKNFHQLEPDVLKVFNANSFINTCGVGGKEKQELFDNLNKIANKINELDENGRIFLYKIIDNFNKNNKSKSKFNITANPYVIERITGSDTWSMHSNLKLLENAGFLDLKELEEDEGELRISYYDNDGNDILNDINNYCLERDLSIKDLILIPDFSVLD